MNIRWSRKRAYHEVCMGKQFSSIKSVISSIHFNPLTTELSSLCPSFLGTCGEGAGEWLPEEVWLEVSNNKSKLLSTSGGRRTTSEKLKLCEHKL